MIHFNDRQFDLKIENGIVFVVEKAVKLCWFFATKLNPQRGFPGVEVGNLITIGREPTFFNSYCWIEETEMFSHKHKSFLKLAVGQEITGVVLTKEFKEGNKESRDVWEDKNYTELVIAYKSSLCTIRDTQWFSGLSIKKY